MKPCPEHREALALLAARALDATGSASAQRHLETCAGCRSFLQDLQRVCGVLENAAPTPGSPELPARFHQRLAARIREDARGNIQVTWAERLARWLALSRISVAAGLAALAVAAFLAWRSFPPDRDERLITRGPAEQPAVVSNSNGARPVRESNATPPPTLIAMRQAWSESSESLDRLLARQEQALAANDPPTTFMGRTLEF